jgi:hypothetical protein
MVAVQPGTLRRPIRQADDASDKASDRSAPAVTAWSCSRSAPAPGSAGGGRRWSRRGYRAGPRARSSRSCSSTAHLRRRLRCSTGRRYQVVHRLVSAIGRLRRPATRPRRAMHHGARPELEDARGLVHVPNPEPLHSASTMPTSSTSRPGRPVLEVDPKQHRRPPARRRHRRAQTCTKCGGASPAPRFRRNVRPVARAPK